MSHGDAPRRLEGMDIAVAGGTGTVGAHVVRLLRERGHAVRVLSRHTPEHPVDLLTGAGLGTALAGCDVVVDASNQPPDRRARTRLADASRRLLAAEAAAGVGHHVGVSIVGCDRTPMGYYRGKAEQDRVIEAGPVPATIVRATQFHELLDLALTAAARVRVLPVPRGLLQPIAAVEAARAIADAAEREPLRGRIEAVGPEVREARELAEQWRAARGRRTPVLPLPLPLPRGLGRALREGRLTNATDPDVRGTITFESWLLNPTR